MSDLLILRARTFAETVHRGQLYGQHAYIKHLCDTAVLVKEHIQFVRGLATQDQLVAAAWLHDTIEDTEIGYDALVYNFGDIVAGLVWSVTDEPGDSREERKMKTYEKTYQAGEQAVYLKLCDRLANVLSCKETKNDQLLKMYQDEAGMLFSLLGPSTEGIMAVWNTLIEELME